MLPKSWILLDNQSTVDVFCNRGLLTNVRETNKLMNIRCNAGVTRTNMVGELNGYGKVWYNPKGIANILSLSQVEKKHRVTYGSTASKAFIVHKNDGSERRFDRQWTLLHGHGEDLRYSVSEHRRKRINLSTLNAITSGC
jgi:hypothetical protein